MDFINGTHSLQMDDTLDVLLFVYKYVFSWLVPFQYVVGCVGTMLCVVVLVMRHSTQKEVRPWFIALSVMDIYVMTIGLPIMYSNIVEMMVVLDGGSVQEYSGNSTDEQGGKKSRYDPRTWSEFNCYGITILHTYGLVASSWVQVGISLLRCISTVVPLTSRSRINVTISRRALCATLLVTLTISIAMVMSTLQYNKEYSDRNGTTGDNGTWVCAQKWDSPYYVYGTLVLRVFLPAVCLIVSTSVILYSLQKFKRAFHNEARRRTLQQRRISLILIGMNTSFLLFALPYEIYLIYVFVRQDYLNSHNTWSSKVIHKIVEKLFAILMYTNNATNWIFYFVLGKRFRQEMRRRMTCTKTRVSKTVHYRFRPGPNAPANNQINKDVGGCGGDGAASQCASRCLLANADVQMELQPLQDSPIGETRQAHSSDTARCHANHRVCHVNFKLSSV